MIEVVGIVFKDNNMYYFNPNGYKLKSNVTVIVETEHGLQFGRVVMANTELSEKKLKKPLKKVIRISNKADYKKHLLNIKLAQEALHQCKQIVENLNLKMNVIDATYTFDREKLIFRFFSDSRVDFRQLAKELAYTYKTRIELRQIGIRDKAKEVGGCGPCGQKLCCARFLKDLDTVSINMAKNQNISLNPSKINGVCGRLLCCLNYENDTYTKNRKKIPKIGTEIKIKEINGKVISQNLLENTYEVETINGDIVKVEINGSKE